MEPKFKIHKGPNGEIKGWGPNVEEYQPGVQDGDTIEYVDELPSPDLNEIAAKKIVEIDAEIFKNICAGFSYDVSGISYHFSYDTLDQQNFADAGNVANLIKVGIPNLPQERKWNAYTDWVPDVGGKLVELTFGVDAFIALYTAGALYHKAACMTEGAVRKKAVRDAVARGASASEIMAI